jgi:hypothetical protein
MVIIKTIHFGNNSNDGISASVSKLRASAYANKGFDMLFPQRIKKFIICILLFVASVPITPSTHGSRDQERTLPLSPSDKAEGQVLWQFDTGG